MSPRSTQQEVLLDLLRSRMGREVPLCEILALRMAQFGARLLELRRQGYIIKNRTEHKGGRVLSWYRLESVPNAAVFTPASKIPVHSVEQIPPPTASSFPQFGNLSPERYPD